MFYEALQMVHNNERKKIKPITKSHKIGSSTHVINVGSQQSVKQFGSSVAIHKLRKSKWFNQNESNILCSVIESGFILEKRFKNQVNDDDDCQSEWGIACWEIGKEKSKNMNFIYIYSAVIDQNKIKVKKEALKNFWTEDSNVRINNHDDKNCAPNSESDIHKQLRVALSNRNLKWHNGQHFTHWCRYTRPNEKQTNPISDRIKWGSIGVTAGILLVKNKFKRTTT